MQGHLPSLAYRCGPWRVFGDLVMDLIAIEKKNYSIVFFFISQLKIEKEQHFPSTFEFFTAVFLSGKVISLGDDFSNIYMVSLYS